MFEYILLKTYLKVKIRLWWKLPKTYFGLTINTPGKSKMSQNIDELRYPEGLKFGWSLKFCSQAEYKVYQVRELHEIISYFTRTLCCIRSLRLSNGKCSNCSLQIMYPRQFYIHSIHFWTEIVLTKLNTTFCFKKSYRQTKLFKYILVIWLSLIYDESWNTLA